MSIRVQRDGKDVPLIPDISGMTTEVTDKLLASTLKAPYQTLLNHFKVDKRPAPSVEDLLSHIRSLRVVSGQEEVRGLSSAVLTQLDDEICATIANIAECNLPATTSPYHTLAAWIGGAERARPVEVFTTNYDLLLEEALEANRVPYFDGFVGSFKTFFDLQAIEEDLLPARWARVWKIHGSLNWFEDDHGTVHRGRIEGARRVIYPSHLKYDESRRMPYLAMLDRLHAFLRQSAAVLIVCGHSFNDMHLNEVMVQGLQGNPTAVAFAFLYGPIGNYPGCTAIAGKRANLNVLAEDAAVIGTKLAKWPVGKAAPDCTDTLVVNWAADPGDPTKRDARFKLGDFSVLAAFTEELIGERHRLLGGI
jgi:hypothetical protein